MHQLSPRLTGMFEGDVLFALCAPERLSILHTRGPKNQLGEFAPRYMVLSVLPMIGVAEGRCRQS